MRQAIALILLTGLFYVLFYNQEAGINILIYEVALLGISLLIFTKPVLTPVFLIVLSATIMSAVFTALYGSGISIMVNFISMFLLVAYRLAPGLRSMLIALPLTFYQIIGIPFSILNTFYSKETAFSNSLRRFVYKLKVALMPLAVISVFLALYVFANSRFSKLMNQFGESIGDFLSRIFGNISFGSFIVIIFGLVIASGFIFVRLNNKWLVKDRETSDELVRKRNAWRGFNMMDLKKEYQAMLFLLFGLNALILVLNVIDIDWVWLNYRWDGGTLKEFVHEGTYILIAAILLSCGIALYIFRLNLNHYKGNNLLKWLTYIWIAQNMLMTLSVAMRTYRYIQHFNLAHLRIGLLYFLLASLIFMVFILLKIKHRKTDFYLIRRTVLSSYLVFFMICPFDWDRIIVSYNFRHSGTGFVHKDWTMTLSDKTLPIIQNNMEFMDGQIDSLSWHSGKASTYRELQEKRIHAFLNRYEKQDWWSCNLAEAKAYKYLKGKE